MKMRLRTLSMAAICLLIISGPAMAGGIFGYGFGVKAGFGVDPDQFVVGVQSVMGKFMKIARFAPSIDFGKGDNLTVWTLNPDIRLRISPPGSSMHIYGQAGPTVAIIDPKAGDSDTEIGLTVSGGLQMPLGPKSYYSLEGRFGFGDIPDFRFLVGIHFGS